MYNLEDKFGRKHDYLRISLTDKCNLRCSYCMPEDICFLPSQKLMTAEEIIHIANVFVNDFGIKKIRITGGEPFVRKDADHILKVLGKLPIELAVTTNAVLLHKFWNTLEAIKLSALNISLDTLHKNKFASINKRDEFEQVMANIHSAAEKGYDIRLNVVMKKGMNEDEVLDFVKLTKENTFHVRFIEFMPFNGNEWNKKEVVSFKNMLFDIEEEFDIVKLNDLPNSTSKSYKAVGHKGTFSFITTVSMPFCSDCNRIRLTADGKLKNCLFSANEMDLLAALRHNKDIRPLIIENIRNKKKELGGLGNLKSDDLDIRKISKRSMFAIGG